MSVPTEIINLKPPPATDEFDSEIEDYLLNPERLSIHNWEPGVLPRQVKIDTLYEVYELPEYIEVENVRDRKTGEIMGYKEKIIDITSEILGDLSMKRPPLPPEQQTRGTTTSLPFWPAGFEDEMLKASSITTILNQMPLNIDGEDEPGKFLGEDLLTVPPDFEYGLEFADDGYTMLAKHKGSTTADTTELEPTKPDEQEVESDEIKFEIEEILIKDDHLKGLWTDTDEKPPEKPKKERRQVKLGADADDSFLDSCLIEEPTPLPEIPVLEITGSSSGVNTGATVTEWAEMLDVTQPVDDFNERIPNMAQKYPFELDTFQKQAILKLEEGHHVFVAAHTSAGKTVVAEYAIALSQRHCTRTIYTSPIKALSNQKYNDFVKTFGDVGLLTGDLQLNPAAACLVMTTEILRSMLYSGSDVTRDLEFVIFDEVHYINNAERGHVWEEVLILLPAHVGIVLLSATVPNTLEFADWVGRTKKRKVYVVSTAKRPVPLCHYLYTGSGGKSKHERFMVVDQDGNFRLKGYNEAVAAKNSRQTDFKKNYGPKGKAMLNPKQEQTLWMAFIDHLKTNDKLPVVAFALSRVRCDMYAENLMCVDLTTAKEKSHIHAFFQRCLQRLKPPDRKLPQVVRLQRVLMNGIGVHHSGILPLLKEIVEMLFQTGFVKILFATETFAMGVNMPARTVVFDEITKFDGVERRNLVPAEYIQMAGRAGRRGLDATGTVIILCKAGVPQLTDLKAMILGIPQRLSSQFRLTYAMILSLMRVASVSVEGMMQRSFREFKQTLKADDYRKQLLQAEKECDEVCRAALPAHLEALAAFYDAALAFVEESGDMMAILLSQPKVAKEIVPGRVLVVSVGPYLNQLAVYLNNKGPRSTPFKVLVLETSKGNQDHGLPNLEVEESWYRILGLCAQHDKVGAEEPTLEHTILCIAHKNILQVTKTMLKVDEAILIQDWEKRQMPRFKDAPVGSTCMQAVQELSRLSHGVHTGAVALEYINLTQNLVISSGERLQALDRIKKLKSEVESLRKSTDIANLKFELGVVYGRKQAERRRDNLRRLLSYESMALYPDYVRRLEVLRELHYIEDQDRVALKGRVACEMGTNELLISELIFGNVLTELEPAEIAALLSALVFQAKTTVEHPLPPRLQAAVLTLQKIDADLRSIEHKYLVSQFEGEGERLNMGLVRVVHEWAQEKPFADIMELTDVQEGIIVRCIQQLNEVLQDVKDAAILIGEPKLQQKMIEASSAIKRDIVFAASLYTTQKEGAD